MPVEDPDDVVAGGLDLFVDRVGEAEALSAALRQHRARITGDLVSSRELKNVLCFYGEGGVGKTELSRQLGDWISGGDAPAHWGSPPATKVDAVVRWDVNDSRGGLDPLPLLAALRVQLGGVEATWAPFDLAFGALHRVVRPGVELTLKIPRAGTTTLNEVVAGLASDIAGGAGLVASGGTGAVAMGLGRGLLALRARLKEHKTLKVYDKLAELIIDCDAASGAIEETAELAGRAAFMLTAQVDRTEPTKRPMVVVFIDHMERLQIHGERHLGEATLNRLVSRLPYFLFVVTGRNSLRWHEHDPALPKAGPRAWPLLSTEEPPEEEPRQHRIGNLSETDSVEFLAASFERHAIDVAPGLVEQLARETDGWPLHLHTIVDVANERTEPDRQLTASDLGGSFPSLVERLLSDLPSDVADAFRAACLLPYFDIEFVMAAGDLSAGAVERLLDRQLVRSNPGSIYPRRIHDRLRELVRGAGSRTAGSWGAADWRRHAELALAEAKRRFDRAMDEVDDVAAIESLALALNVAVENDVFDEWIVEAIRVSPSIDMLAPKIAATAADLTGADLTDTLNFLHLKAKALRDDVTDEFRAIALRRTVIASSAGLWRAYELRKRGRANEAVGQLEWLLAEFNDRPALYNNQIVTTLRLARRFEDAVARLGDLTEVQQAAQRATLARRHGDYEGSTSQIEVRLKSAKSRRFQIELTGERLTICNRELGVTTDEALHVLAIASDANQLSATCDALAVLAQINLLDDQRFEGYFGELLEYNARRFQSFQSPTLTLALRAWALDDRDLAHQARQLAASVPYRDASWISSEILLEHLGVPLEPVPTQWLEPYDVVRHRWLELLWRTVERARSHME